MSVSINVNIECDGCCDAWMDEDDRVYCEDCYDRLQATIEGLELEAFELNEEILVLTQENEELRVSAT